MAIEGIDDYSGMELSNFSPVEKLESSWNGRVVGREGGVSFAFPNMGYTKHDYRLAGGRVESGNLEFDAWFDQKNGRIDYGGKVGGTIHFGPGRKKENDNSPKEKTPEPKPPKD